MLTSKSVFAYRKQFPDDNCFFSEPGSEILIETKEKAFISPSDETDEVFSDRLVRSKKIGRNLFYEEWDTFEYNPDYIY